LRTSVDSLHFITDPEPLTVNRFTPMPRPNSPLVGIVMGSKSDWETMQHCRDTLGEFGVESDCRVLSAHRTPHAATEFAVTAEERGLEIIVAAAGGAAHLAGVMAAHTVLPVLGVPMQGWSLDGLDSLLSTVQMPRGVPVGTLAIGKAGAVNSALLAVAILAGSRPELRQKLKDYRRKQTEKALGEALE
jgi:5-(carboxyamino)imidazole ribonucleotide mutase